MAALMEDVHLFVEGRNQELIASLHHGVGFRVRDLRNLQSCTGYQCQQMGGQILLRDARFHISVLAELHMSFRFFWQYDWTSFFLPQTQTLEVAQFCLH